MSKTIDLSGKTALVTGASRGIGAAVAKAYAKAGAHVVLLARTVGGLEAVDDEIRAAGGNATLMPVDLMKLDELDALGPTLYERFGGLDIFVGNAGMLGTLSPLGHIDPKEWQKVIDTNVSANFRLLRTLDPLLQKSDNGRVIFVTTSEDVIDGRAYWGTYGVSKAALETLARTYAAENDNKSLKVNIVDPGRVRTDMRAAAKPGEDPLTLPSPDDVVPKFLELAAPDCNQNGAIIHL